MTEHGTRSKYINDRCRCDACSEANKDYYRNRGNGICEDCGEPTSFGASKRCRECYLSAAVRPRGRPSADSLEEQSDLAIAREKFKRLEEERIAALLKPEPAQPVERSNESVWAGYGWVRQGNGRKVGWGCPMKGAVST